MGGSLLPGRCIGLGCWSKSSALLFGYLHEPDFEVFSRIVEEGPDGIYYREAAMGFAREEWDRDKKDQFAGLKLENIA